MRTAASRVDVRSAGPGDAAVVLAVVREPATSPDGRPVGVPTAHRTPVLPAPSTVGKTSRRSSSTRSFSVLVAALQLLPPRQRAALVLRGWRMVTLRANGQPALAAYAPGPDGTPRLHTLQVLAVTGRGIARNVVFADPQVVTASGVAPVVDPATPERLRAGACHAGSS